MSTNFQATPGELSLVSRILAQGDPTKTGHLAGDVAVRIFGGAKLQPTVLGEIWSLADEDNQGSLSSKGVAVAVRLMGWAQAGDKVNKALIAKPGPLPTIDGVSDVRMHNTGMSAPRSPPPTGGLPALTAQDKAKFQTMFYKSGPSNGLLSGDRARDIFVKSKLATDKLGQIWTLADTHDRGSLDATDFTIAMYLIQGAMSGLIPALPATLPPGIYQQAAGMPGPAATHATGNSGSYSPVGSTFSQNRLQPQYTGQSQMLQPNMTGSMSSRRGAPAPPHLPARPNVSQVASSAFGGQPKWDITAAEKQESDGFFDTLDTSARGFIEGDVAVPFMLESKLPGEDLALVWDLADLNNDGRLTKDGFAVAMYLIKKKLAGGDIPTTLPASLVPPSMRKTNGAPASPFASQAAPAPSAAESIADLLWDDPPPAAAAPVVPQSTGFGAPAIAPQNTGFSAPAIAPQSTGFSAPNYSSPASRSPAPVPPRPAAQDPFGASAFGSNAAQDLMGDDDGGVTASPPLQDKSAEIGNVQNQLSSTNRSLAATKTDREEIERNLAEQASQLSSLQTQLSAAKASYETETKLLAGLRERLFAQTSEITKTRESIISAESDLSAVRVEKSEVEGAVLRDKEDVRDLNRKMAEFSQQSEALKAEAEKLKKEAKQQRGLLAIARKQLSSKEAEKAKAEKDMQDAAAELASVTREKQDVDTEIAQVEEDINTLAFSTPAPASNVAPERALSSDSLSFAASQALPVTPDPSSPAGGKSNNPFERLAMSSGQSTPARSESPFMPFAASTALASPTNNSVLPTSGSGDPFGFDEVFATEPTPATDLPVEATPKVAPAEIAPVSPSTLERAASPTSPTSTEDFKTPPTSSAFLPDAATPPRSTTLDVASSKFPPIGEAAPPPAAAQFPGHFPTASEHTDLNAPLKEIELDEDSSSDEDDEMPLAELAAKAKSNSARNSVAQSESKGETSFDDVFGVGETTTTANGEAASNSPGPASANDVFASPFAASSSPSPFGASDAFGAPEAKASSPMAGVNAFDEAMGIAPSSGAGAAPAQAFSFDDGGFDDNFDFGGASASEPTPAPASLSVGTGFPAPPKANGATSPLKTTNDGFDSLFSKPAGAAATNGNGNGIHPTAEAAPAPAIVTPSPAAGGPSFDEVFSGFDSSAPATDLGASLGSPTTSTAPASAPAPPAPAPIFPVASPPKSILNNRAASPSPPPRVSSPTPSRLGPRQSTSSSIKEVDRLKEPPARHSKLSIRLPFGKKKKQAAAAAAEMPVPSPSQFLTPPAEEDRTPAGDDDVDAVKQITAMGFSRSQAVEALEKYSYDVPRALNSLLGQ